MKETKKQTIVVTEYTTDFGTKFTDKDLCKECEIQEYKRVYSSLYDIANSEQKILLIAIMKELSEHLSSAYCEQGISNDGIADMVEFYCRKH
jgi:hypothetical protein